MNISNQKKKNYLYFFIFLIGIIILSFQIIYIPNQKLYKIQKQKDLLLLSQQGLINQWFKETHINESWIQNSDFNTETGWNSVFGGDVNDVSADIKNGEANFNVIGETYTTTLISGTPNSTSSPDWHNATNPDIPVYPTQGHAINQFGCFASHLWAEHIGTTTNAYQKTSVQWEKVITTPINMSDYTVTNASINVLINATAKSYIGCGSGDVWHWEGVEVSGDSGTDRLIEGDYVRFYVRLSNLDKNVNYKVAQYQNSTLGQDGAAINGSYDYQYDKVFEADDIDDLIFYLNQVLENGDFQNFYIILGMEFNCEDNCATDLDEFSEVYIKECNFSISYVKKINQLTSVSWKYIGNQIDAKGGVVEILDSHLFFKYKINNTWPTTLSPNSEFRILINNREISETIKLSNAETSFKTAKEEGFDVAKLIPNDKDISVSIQVFLADNFDLEENYTISIDDVILKLSYDIFFPAQRDLTFLVLLIIALITSGLLATYFVYYRRVLRFPPPVRKVRKYRKTLNKINPPTITIQERNKAFNAKYKRALKTSSGVLGIKPLERYKLSDKRTVKKITKPKLSKELIIVLLILMGLFLIPIVYFVGINPLKTNNNSKLFITLSKEESSNLFRRESFEEQWIKNSGFGVIDNWTSIIEGDTTDLDSSINGGNANYEILGDSGSQVFYENGSSSGWINIANDDNLPWPDVHQMTADGWFASENWPDNAPQSLQTQWKKNFSMNVNMSDYYITSASLTAWINGSAQATSMDNGGIDRPGDELVFDPSNDVQIATGDFAKFFIMISDVGKNREFEATHYQTDDLGKDGPPPITQLNDTIMVPINEETLIFYLEQALQYDYHNFSITLGIYIWCEDSGHPDDRDNWQSLLIKNFTLSISYEKKIDQFNSISWKYNGEKLEAGGYRIEVTDARLNFEFKINQPWPTDLSPNSKFRIFINDIEHNETIRLNELSTIFQNIDEDGFDVTKLIPENDEINVTLQVYLADEFRLDNQLVISIDNVILWIHYNVLIPIEPNYLFQILFAVAVTGAVCLTSYIILYQRVLKYPKPVRKVRKYIRTLNKTQSPAISIEGRKSSFNKMYQEELKKTAKFLRGTPVDGKILRDKLLGDISKNL